MRFTLAAHPPQVIPPTSRMMTSGNSTETSSDSPARDFASNPPLSDPPSPPPLPFPPLGPLPSPPETSSVLAELEMHAKRDEMGTDAGGVWRKEAAKEIKKRSLELWKSGGEMQVVLEKEKRRAWREDLEK